MREIGKSVSDKVIDDYFKDSSLRERGVIIDRLGKKIIRMEEFYTPNESTTLDWENLGVIRKRDLRIYEIGFFKDLLYHLILPLNEKGEYNTSLKKDSFGIVNYGANCFVGIETHSGRSSDFHGRRYPDELVFYPRRIEDARGYKKHILNGDGYIARIEDGVNW